MVIVAERPLQSSVAGDRACFWFRASDGSDVSLTWPAGSSAHTDPLRVLDRDGHVIATTGDTGLSFTGSFLEGRAGCSGSDSKLFVAGEVSKGSGG
jgi:hypothetical protein